MKMIDLPATAEPDYWSAGYDRIGHSRIGHSQSGYNQVYSRSGYDMEGYDISGYSRSGYHRDEMRYRLTIGWTGPGSEPWTEYAVGDSAESVSRNREAELDRNYPDKAPHCVRADLDD